MCMAQATVDRELVPTAPRKGEPSGSGDEEVYRMAAFYQGFVDRYHPVDLLIT